MAACARYAARHEMARKNEAHGCTGAYEHKMRPLISRLIKAACNPLLAVNYLKSKALKTVDTKEYVGAAVNRSDSDNGLYVSFVQSTVQNYSIFSTFKRHPCYRDILEHVTKEDGEKYLEIIKKESPSFINLVDRFKENDLVGNPIVFNYPDVGTISPTTLRYIKVASDLRKLFGNDIGNKIIEIGVGYGGQLLVNDRIFKITEYELLDLPPVLNLVSKYLENHILNCAYKTSTLNQKKGDEWYDLLISNYAFSELPSQLQLKYIEKVVVKAKRGYMTMNSGLNPSSRAYNKLSINELRAHLPPFEILPEVPLTSADNYIIVWGHDKST